MERKDYEKRVIGIKNDIMTEIRNLLGEGNEHRFNDAFYIHYINGEVATTEVCLGVKVFNDGMVAFCTNKDESWSHGEIIEGTDIYKFEPESFFDIVTNLKEELREEKLRTLHKLIVANDGPISFEGECPICHKEADYSASEQIRGIEVRGDNELLFFCTDGDEEFWRSIDLNIGEIDILIEYVRKQTEKTPEERLALTDKQKIIVARIKHDIEMLGTTGAEIFLDNENGALFVANTGGEDFDSTRSDERHCVMVDIAKLPSEDVIGSGYVCYTSQGIWLTKK